MQWLSNSLTNRKFLYLLQSIKHKSIIMIKFNRLFLVIMLMALFTTSCKKDDPPLPDNTVQFEAAEQGISTDASSATVSINLSRAAASDVVINIGIAENGVAYTTDYTTTPATSSGSLAVTIPAGSTAASFTVNKTPGVLLDGDEQLTFTITSATSPIVIGSTAQLSLSFAEILSSGATLTIDGGGATYPNKVFIDLSANRQTAVHRTNWDLGFAAGEAYRVVLNSSTTMMAKVLDKNDLTQVSAADTVGFAAAMNINAFSTAAMAYIDDPSGDLTKTAIAEVAANDADNKVYIINRGADVASAPGVPAASRGWKKIRILRTATGYTLQYADIDATTFNETAITKNGLYNFNYIHFDNGPVEVEPVKDRWDIAWTYFMNTTNFGTGAIPYTFQDMILLNGTDVAAAKVLGSNISYDAFSATDLSALTFTATQTTIGSDWRATSQSGTASVYTDRYYIVKDGGDNYYKLRFTALTTNGERGKPVFEYALVKAGE